jgi:hypothetical protein
LEDGMPLFEMVPEPPSAFKLTKFFKIASWFVMGYYTLVVLVPVVAAALFYYR